jgi:hypothetical protein
MGRWLAKLPGTRLGDSVGDPDPHVFGPPGSGSTGQKYGSGSFIFQNGVMWTEIMLAK